MLFLLGEADQMTPPRAAAAWPQAAHGRTVTVQAGHALMGEAPDDVLLALRNFWSRAPVQAAATEPLRPEAAQPVRPEPRRGAASTATRFGCNAAALTSVRLCAGGSDASIRASVPACGSIGPTKRVPSARDQDRRKGLDVEVVRQVGMVLDVHPGEARPGCSAATGEQRPVFAAGAAPFGAQADHPGQVTRQKR